MMKRFWAVLGILAVCAAPLSAAAATTITSSALDHIVISPNDRPTRVDILSDQQFIAIGYAAGGQVLSGLTFTWTTDGDVGKISSDGIFSAQRGGIGKITARNGSVTASVGVVVKGVAAAAPVEEEQTPTPSTTVVPTTNTNTANGEQTEDGDVAGETVDENEAAAAGTTESCTTLRAWAWLIILFVYCILLFAYYLSLGESRTMWWWFWPALFTAAPVALFFGTRCAGTATWVPWTTGILAILITVFYVRVLRPSESIATSQKLS